MRAPRARSTTTPDRFAVGTRGAGAAAGPARTTAAPAPRTPAAETPCRRRDGARPSRAPRGPTSAGVALDVRQECQIAGALDRDRQLALMPGRHPTEPARKNLAALGQEAAQELVVLVIDDPNSQLGE